MYIAVHYKKFDLDDEKCFFIPTDIMYGDYDKITDLFFSDSGMVCYPINSKNPLAYEYFSSPKTMKKLRKEYGENLSDDELIAAFFYETRDNCYVGLYNEESITVLSIAVYDIEEEIIAKGKSKHAKLIYFDKNGKNKINSKISIDTIDEHQEIDQKSELSDGFNEINKGLDELEKSTDKQFVLKWNVETPYKTLGITEKEYTKKELLKILSEKIKQEQNRKTSNKQKVKKIDSYLDAYNEINKDLR